MRNGRRLAFCERGDYKLRVGGGARGTNRFDDHGGSMITAVRDPAGHIRKEEA